MKHIWIVEIKIVDEWMPTTWCSMNRAHGRENLKYIKWRQNNPARLVRYYSND